MSKNSPAYERDLRSHDEIMLAARQMRADYMRELFGKLRIALFGGRESHGQGPVLAPQTR